jgi:hypothetical protein
MTYTFPSHITGDTYRGAVITIRDENQTPINLTTGTVRIRFRFGSKSGNQFRDLTISVTNGAAGEITIPAQIINWNAGLWFYDMEVTLSGVVTTYMEGTMRIIQSTTN